MGRTEWSKEALGESCHEGTSARTRPFSFEEIMLRRIKKNAMDSKSTVDELKDLPAKIVETDNQKSDRAHKKTEDSEFVMKESSKKPEDKKWKVEGNHSEGKHKRNRDSESDMKVKSRNTASTIDRESRKEKQGNYKTRTTAHPDKLEKDLEKKRLKDVSRKKKHGERERILQMEGKRKHHSHVGAKNRCAMDGPVPKKQDSDKLKDSKHLDRNYRKMEHTQVYNEEPRSKRIRSRSREYGRERDRRSLSISPRAHRHLHHERERGKLSSFKDNSMKKYYDDDRYKTSGTGGHSTGHYWKRGSGLGGYSPRKRKAEVAVKTPSPMVRSPERKSTTWDQPPAGRSHASVSLLDATLQPPASKMHELASSASLTSAAMKPQTVHSSEVPSPPVNASIDSVHLTQATRPMRRLYVENLPPSASEKTVVDCLNNFLLSSGVNHIQGTKPCISCIVNKEKGQALVEFLTPEDAKAALYFDGRSFSGFILKIRRPKDFIETPIFSDYILRTHVCSECLVYRNVKNLMIGAAEKPGVVVQTISHVVRDSPHKIFIAGVSKVLSSDMLKEIASAFGLLKSYHFEFKEELNGPCAFLEYIEPGITMKACAGLNGMKLGGNVLTAVQAIPDADEGEDIEGAPSYDIPEHVKPLLACPTKVLQLKNMFRQGELPLLSQTEVEETLEDIRFGTVKSVNLVRNESSCTVVPKAFEQNSNGGSTNIEPAERSNICNSEQCDYTASPNKIEEAAEITNMNDDKPLKYVEEKDSAEYRHLDEPNAQEEKHHELGSPQILSNNNNDDNIEDPRRMKALVLELIQEEGNTGTMGDSSSNNLNTFAGHKDAGNGNSEQLSVSDVDMEHAIIHKAEASGHQTQDLNLFEAGCVLVEYLREEAACMAAHFLHGRSYNDHVVASGYVPHDLYLARFPR